MGLITIYQIEFKNKEEDTILVQITDRLNVDIDNVINYVDLIGVAPAFELETFNTSEDKFNPILGLRATFRFKSTNQYNFSTFATGEDYRFFVRVTTGSSFLFSGWLVMDDNQQAYLPAGQPVTLVATDNLAALKEIELSDFNDLRPTGKYRIIEIIAWCLRKTEGPFPGEGAAVYDGIKVAMNLFEFNNHSTVNNCPLNQTYIDVLTFEKNASELEDCYTVLTKILISLNCRLSQYNNYWYILRIDEYKNSAFVLHNYGLAGNYISRTLGATFDKNIDTSEIDIVQAETIQRIQRPYKSARCFINHELPSELPCNNAFLRGTLVTSSATEEEYDPECWTFKKGPPDVANNGTARIRVLLSASGKETDRYFAFHVQPSDSGYYIESEPIYVCAGDRFSLSVDVRHDGQIETGGGTGNIFVMQLRLYADDSTYYNFDPVDDVTTIPSWVQSDVTWATNLRYFKRFFDGTDDDTLWNNVGTTAEDAVAFPKSGYVTISLVQAYKSDEFEFHYSNLRFTYEALIDGTFESLKGQEFKMSSDGNYAKKLDKQFYLFDGPCHSFKGAMHYFDSPDYLLTANWIDFAMEQYAIPDLLDYGYEFLHWQCNALWNQARLETWVLNSYLLGMDVANGYISLIHKISVSNALSPVSNLNFLILSFRQNWHDCTWTATIAEINDETNVRQGGGGSGENFEFKYF